MADLCGLEACYPKALPPMWLRAPSPVNATYLANYLADHPDREFATYICQGLWNGFHIGFARSIVLHSSTKNHPSSLANAAIVDEHIGQDLEMGRLVGPVLSHLVPLVHTSPRGLISKPYQSRKVAPNSGSVGTTRA